jgi:5-(carboxyamino)imidazole ribonucleotide synthase
MTPTEALPPGSIIGILGGGQLGRMLALAAARLGMRAHIYSPDPESPAFDVTPRKTIAAYENEAALTAFAAAVDVVTYEFENVPAETAHLLARLAPLRPGDNALAVAQDRVREKVFITQAGIAVAPYREVGSLGELEAALSDLGTPAVLKTTRLGYDGKGQRLIRDPGEAAAAFAALAHKPLVLEAFIAFDKEISVVVARGLSGEVRAFEPAENVHRHHILHTSTVPATIPPALAAAAITAASAIATALDYVGVLGVEFFVTGEGLLVNEIAPRVHNSGHWTQAVCITDQFEQHIRAVCGWPLGDPTRLADVVMENLIGDDVLDIASRLGTHDRLELYGKREARPGRKMGHLNHVAPWRSAK